MKYDTKTSIFTQLKKRTRHTLTAFGIDTEEKLLSLSEQTLLKVHGFSRKSLQDLKTILHRNNLTLCDKEKETGAIDSYFKSQSPGFYWKQPPT